MNLTTSLYKLPHPQLEEYDKTLEQVPMKELLKANAKEWPYILLGILGSIIEGSAFPVFAILFGQVLRVCLCCPAVLSWLQVCCMHTLTAPTALPQVFTLSNPLSEVGPWTGILAAFGLVSAVGIFLKVCWH